MWSKLWSKVTKSVLMPLGLTAAPADVRIYRKNLRSGTSGSGTIILIISNEETKDIMKIIKSL